MSGDLIYQLIPKVMADVGAIGKDRKNESQNYRFRGVEDFYNACHPAMVKHGVFCVPQVQLYDYQDRIAANGKASVRVTLRISHRFYAGDGSYVEVITLGEGVDSSDKAANKAMSAALKYALAELLMIPTADIEDADRTTPEVGIVRGKVEQIQLKPKAPLEQEPTPESPVEIPAIEGPVYITQEQKVYLSRRFRQSLKPELQGKDNELRHQVMVSMDRSKLFKSRFIDDNGNPTSEFVLADEYAAVGKALVAAAKAL